MEHYSHLSPPDTVANDPYVPLLLNLLFRVQDLYRLFSRCLAATWPLTCRDHKRIDARHDVMLCRLVWIRSSLKLDGVGVPKIVSFTPTGDGCQVSPQLEYLIFSTDYNLISEYLAWFLQPSSRFAVSPARNLRVLLLGSTCRGENFDRLSLLLNQVLQAATSLAEFEYSKISP